jgi:hypothetical protein
MMREKAMSSPVKSDNSEIEDPSDFTDNLVEYMKGIKTYSSHTKTSSSVTIAAVSNAPGSVNKTFSNADEEDLCAQITRLQAQLMQKDDKINNL